MSTTKKKRLEAKLDGRQKLAALAVVERDFAAESDRKGFEEIAAEVGVCRNTLYEWRTQNRAFIEYANYLADEFLESRRSLVYRQLMKLIDGPQPSVKGIDLYLRRHGLLTDKSVVETSVADAKSNEDIAKDIDELDELLAEDDGAAN